jgi:(S)-ureidoglycine-glyoxylate aminotransferase
LFGDQSQKMHNVVGVYIPENVAGEAVRSSMLNNFGIEIGTSFGPLHGKIWRIGTMGYNARKDAVLQTLIALEAVLRRTGHSQTANAGVDTAMNIYAHAGY